MNIIRIIITMLIGISTLTMDFLIAYGLANVEPNVLPNYMWLLISGSYIALILISASSTQRTIDRFNKWFRSKLK